MAVRISYSRKWSGDKEGSISFPPEVIITTCRTRTYTNIRYTTHGIVRDEVALPLQWQIVK